MRVGAVLCFSVMAAAVKLVSDDGLTAPQLIFFRNVFALPVVIAWLAIGPGFAAVRTRRPGAHLTRAAIGLVSMILAFQSIIMLPLPEATTIGFAAPCFATLFSAVLLGEAVGRHRWTAVIVGLLGVALVMRPSGQEIPFDGLMVALAGTLGVAAVTITIRQIGATEGSATIVFWFNILALMIMGSILPLFGGWPDDAPWIWLVIVGVTGGLAQLLMTESLRLAPVAVLAPFDYLQLIGALLLGWLIWADLPAWTTVAGGMLIVGAGLYTAWREHLLDRMAASATPPIT